MVVPGQPYVSAGQTFGEYLIRLDVLALVARDSYPVALSNLDAAVAAVLEVSEGWGLAGVEQPSLVTVGAAEVLGTVVSLQIAARP